MWNHQQTNFKKPRHNMCTYKFVATDWSVKKEEENKDILLSPMTKALYHPKIIKKKNKKKKKKQKTKATTTTTQKTPPNT